VTVALGERSAGEAAGVVFLRLLTAAIGLAAVDGAGRAQRRRVVLVGGSTAQSD
jgi:hypothetical protein